MSLSDQEFGIPLDSIVPEYSSRNPLVRWLFRRRLSATAAMAGRILPTPELLLDLGCGSGLLEPVLHGYFPRARVIGIDLNVNLTGRGRQRDEFRSRQDIEMLGVRGNTVDAIFCLDVLEHFKYPSRVLSECRRVLKSGGILVTSAPTESTLYRLLRWVLKGTTSSSEGPAAGVHHQNAASLHEMVKSRGFECVRLKKLPWGMFPVLFELRVYRVKNHSCGSHLSEAR